LQSFCPLHACFAAGVAGAAAGAAVVPVALSGAFGGGVDPPQPAAPIKIPPTAAAIIVLVGFMASSRLHRHYVDRLLPFQKNAMAHAESPEA
jgi:hypothetical protein